MLLLTPMPTLAEAVDLITLMMYTAGGMKPLYLAVNEAIMKLEYTTVDQEGKPELSVLLVSVYI